MKSEFNNICILPIRPEDVELLCQRMGANDNADYELYVDMQSKDEGVYLIAWAKDIPVAHLLIRWTGNTEVPRIVDQYPQAAQFADRPEYLRVICGSGATVSRNWHPTPEQALQLARARGAPRSLFVWTRTIHEPALSMSG